MDGSLKIMYKNPKINLFVKLIFRDININCINIFIDNLFLKMD